MIDDSKLNEIVTNMKVAGQEAFVGAMPEGEVVLTKIATEPKVIGTGKNSVSWYPVTFKASDGEHEVSLKGLLQAEGLRYTTRNLTERTAMWFALLDKGANAAARKFDYTGKKGKEVTYKKEWTDFNGVTHMPGEKGVIEGHTFKSKLVG